MSYDLLVWEGSRPGDARELRETLDEIRDRSERGGQPDPPSPRIAEFIEALLRRWPDGEGAASPWSVSGTGYADGSVLSVHIQWSREEEVSEFVAGLAQVFGLVCYDFQRGRGLRP